ncbi:thioredoxin family protein [Fibrivirga algicola]|uniref:Thioredoxin family protein n=1 Tax=Fibrivirga algicola TaxID=2950420 RepID=A0ABX0QC91_9BACT|nr:thioredoxin family protein [Fibrivirga algicola]NID09769.1 thioredoxin family protein [Fibrivirga algicola]
MKSLLLTILLGALTLPVLAQRPASGYTLGDVAASFALTNVDNRTISLAEYKNQKGVIVVFTSNHCPFSKAYEDRIIALDRKFGPQGFPVIALLSSDATLYEEDSFDRMQVRARTKNYTFPYLHDDSQAVAKAFGATRTPQVYVLKRTGDRFTVEYIGSVDDSPQDAVNVQRAYVDEAVTSLLAGKPVVTPLTKAIGCAVKLK